MRHAPDTTAAQVQQVQRGRDARRFGFPKNPLQVSMRMMMAFPAGKGLRKPSSSCDWSMLRSSASMFKRRRP